MSQTSETTPDEPKICDSDRAVLLAAYSEAGAQRRTYDTLFWSVPGFAFAAWAVALSMARSENVHLWYRALEGAVAFGVAIFSWHLSERLWELQHTHALALANIEDRLRFATIVGLRLYGTREEKAEGLVSVAEPNRLARKPSHVAWRVFAILLVAVALVVTMLSVFDALAG